MGQDSDDEKEHQQRFERILARRQERLGISRDEALKPAAEPSLFLEIEERRLREAGCDLDELLRRDLEEIRDIPYPGPDCLEPDEVLTYAETRMLPAERLAHARQCLECGALLAMAERRPPGLLREPPVVEAPRRRWVQPVWSPGLVTACLLLVIGLFQLVRGAIPTAGYPVYAGSFVLPARSSQVRTANEVRSINGACFLALAAKLSAVPGELRATLDTLQQAERLSLTAADRDLAALPAGERQTLARLLGSGSLVRCEGEVAPQGVSLTVEIAQGTALERQSFTAAGMAEIPDLTRRAGQWALAKLGRTATPPREARYAIPVNVEALHDFAVGLSHLADHQPAEARQSLEAALEHEQHPLVYAALADSFTQLGNTNGARDSLRAAVDRAALALYPPPERQELEAKYSVASARWGDAIEAFSDLEKSSPDPFESSFQVAAAYLATTNAKEAQAKIAEIRKSQPSEVDTARLNLLEARAADILSDPERQLRTALAAAGTGRKLGARSLEAEASLAAGRAARTRALPGDSEKSALLFQRALDLASASRDENGRATALLEQGISAFLNEGDTQGVEERLREAFDIYREQHNRGGIATAEIRLGHLDADDGRPGALEHYEKALRTFKSLGNQRGTAEALLSRGVLQWLNESRDLTGADRDFAAALEIFRRISDRGGEARVLVDRGQLLMERGQVRAARQDLEKSLAIRKANGLRRDEAASHAVLAEALLVADDLRGAEDHLGESLDLYEKISGDGAGRSPQAAQARLQRSVVWLEKGELDDAETELGQLLDLSRSLRRKFSEKNVQLALAQLYLLREDAARAESALKLAGKGDGQTLLAARIDLAEGRRDAALTTLRQLVQAARDRGLVLVELEARLALAEAQLTDQKEAARGELRTVADRANALGAKLLARKAVDLLHPQGAPLSNRILSALSSFSSRF